MTARGQHRATSPGFCAAAVFALAIAARGAVAAGALGAAAPGAVGESPPDPAAPAPPANTAAPVPAGASGAQPAPAAPPAKPEAHPLHVRTAAQPDGEITLGEPVVWTIAIDHDARDTYAPPEKIDPSPLALLGAPSSQRTDAAGLTTTTIRFTFADYKSLEPQIPDLVLRVEGPAGERALTVPGKKLSFHSLIASEGQDSQEHAHHGPKPPVAVMVRSYLWIYLLLGIAATALGANLIQRLIARRRLREKAPPPAMPADEEALQRLAALKAQPPGRGAIFTLSEIVRAYLGRRLEFNALDSTSDELLDKLCQRRLPGLDLRAFEQDVRWQDLVKFAKLEPLPEEFASSIASAEALVRKTRLVPKPKTELASPPPANPADETRAA